MTEEKVFENQIKAYLRKMGVWYVKFFANGFTKKGIPDILCCANGHFLGIEVKSATGRPSEEQIYQIEEIKKAGGYALVVYPKDFEKLKHLIEDLLRDENTES